MRKRGWACWLLALTLLAGCAGPAEEGPASDAGAPAEVPAGPAEEDWTEERKYVAITFDDGPRRDTTSLLLDGLLERGVAATFFVIGEQVPSNQDLLQRMKAEGHQIGNHTYSHVRLKTASDDAILEEIHKAETLIGEAVGEGSYWLRPPYGLITAKQAELVKTPMIYWTVDSEDWKLLDAKKVTDRVLASVGPGDVILLHDFYPTSVDAALEIIDQMLAQGYVFVTLEELFRIQGVTPQAGVLYRNPQRVKELA